MYEGWYPFIVSVVTVSLVLSFAGGKQKLSLWLTILGLLLAAITPFEFLDAPRYASFYESLPSLSLGAILSFLDTELFLIVPFYTSNKLGLPYSFASASFMILSYLIGLYMSGKGRSNYVFASSLIMCSPMHPFLFGNVIRQGASCFILLAAFCNLSNSRAIVIILASPLFHRYAMPIVLGSLIKTWKHAFLGISIFFPIALLLIINFSDEILKIREFYNSFDTLGIGGTDALRSFLRFLLIFSPIFFCLLLKPRLAKIEPKIAVYFAILFLAYLIAIKAGDRIMYFGPAVVAYFAIQVKDFNNRLFVSGLIGAPLIVLLGLGYYG
jgi:hypothetical protein